MRSSTCPAMVMFRGFLERRLVSPRDGFCGMRLTLNPPVADALIRTGITSRISNCSIVLHEWKKSFSEHLPYVEHSRTANALDAYLGFSLIAIGKGSVSPRLARYWESSFSAFRILANAFHTFLWLPFMLAMSYNRLMAPMTHQSPREIQHHTKCGNVQATQGIRCPDWWFMRRKHADITQNQIAGLDARLSPQQPSWLVEHWPNSVKLCDYHIRVVCRTVQPTRNWQRRAKFEACMSWGIVSGTPTFGLRMLGLGNINDVPRFCYIP